MPSKLLSAMDNPSPSMVNIIPNASDPASSRTPAALLLSANPSTPRSHESSSTVEKQREVLRAANSRIGGKAAPAQLAETTASSSNGATLLLTKSGVQNSASSPRASAASSLDGVALSAAAAAAIGTAQSASVVKGNTGKHRGALHAQAKAKLDESLDTHANAIFEQIFEVGREESADRGRIVKASGVGRGRGSASRGRGGGAARGGNAAD
jgi:hypothetical protein